MSNLFDHWASEDKAIVVVDQPHANSDSSENGSGTVTANGGSIMTTTAEPVSLAKDEDLGGKPNPGTPKDKRLKDNKKTKTSTPHSGGETVTLADGEGDAETDPDAMIANSDLPVMSMDPHWRGVLVVEGVPTGDGREFSPDSLKWAEPPLPLRWLKVDSHGGMPTNETVRVGTIQRVWRGDDGKIMGEGVFDLEGPADDDAHAAYQDNQSGALTGISIDADDITDADIEYVFDKPEGEEDEGENGEEIIMLLFAQPDKVIFHSARIRAATLCDIPAFVEARITAIPEGSREDAVTAGLVADTLGAVGVHHGATSDSSWDGPANEARLEYPVPLATAKKAYAWYDAGQVENGALSKSACKFIHHEISSEGTPGPANLRACSTGIGVLNGGRGGTTIPDSDKRGVYNHLAAHLRDAGREPPEYEGSSSNTLVASARVTEEWRPPKKWFQDPKLGQYVPIMITDQNRIYGHAAPWGECHLGFQNECIMPPFEQSHDYFMTGEVICDDDSRIAVGQITASIDHAPMEANWTRAKQHYEVTSAVVADVVVGNDVHGIWVAGAVRPWADKARVHELRASGQVSPDWRFIGNGLRMVGLLTVNISGYQVPRPKSLAHVAGGQIRTLIVENMTPVSTGLAASAQVYEQERERLMTERRKLIERVHGKEEN